jgi:pimeloyl-ACP methyl ester carboxylesterase
MPHVTFVHGIGNKPLEDQLLAIWRRSLADGLGLDLGASGVSSSMVYWADVLYKAPDPNAAAHESTLEATTAAVDATDNPGPPPSPGLDEAIFMASLAAKIGGTLAAVKTAEEVPPDRTQPGAQAATFERIPLPWPIKKAFLETFLRDVHHYLFDSVSTPRPNETYRVQQEIRNRFVAKLEAVPDNRRPHVVVAHSLGTVISYDCLKRDPRCPKIDGLITVGSPLGLDEVQDKLQPGWTRADGFPHEKLAGRWVNLFDHLDPVAGFDPFLASDFRMGGNDKVTDINEQSHGAWRHSMVKYLHGARMRQSLSEMLGA